MYDVSSTAIPHRLSDCHTPVANLNSENRTPRPGFLGKRPESELDANPGLMTMAAGLLI